MEVPAFLLRRLYLRGSLRNVDGSFEFDLKNLLGAGYAERMLPLMLDGDALRLEEASFSIDGDSAATAFSDVSGERPFTLAMNKLVTIRVAGRTLANGKHTLGIGFVVTGMGEMRFDVTDAIGDVPGAEPETGVG